jgi:hypothetical protein
MTQAPNPKPWFDTLAQAVAGDTVSRRHLLDRAARHATPHANPTSPDELTAIAQRPVTRRTGLKMLGGAIAAFLAAGLRLPTVAGAQPTVSAADCLANCRNYEFESIRANLLKATAVVGVPAAILAFAAAIAYRFDVTCLNECGLPPPTTTPPTTTTPSPPSNATCPPPTAACGIFCLDPNTYICCPTTSSAGYCSLGEMCCVDHCALTSVGC